MMIIKKILPMLLALLIFLSIGAASAADFDTNSISQSAGTVKNYVETNKTLPTSVTVDGQQVTPYQYLYLLTQGVQNLDSGNSAPITSKSVAAPTNPSESLNSGSLTKTEYLSIASRINTFINTNGRLPNYLTTSLGKMRCENLIYSYAKIMEYYKNNNKLPNTIAIKSWASITSGSNPSNSSNTVTMSQVGSSAGTVKSYYESNKKLPSTVTIASKTMSMASFLNILTIATVQANSGSTSAITLKSVDAASSPYGNIVSGSIPKSEFLSVAQNIISYINDNNKAPNYVTTSIGDLSFDNAVYLYSKIMNYYKSNGRLPSYVSMTSSSSGSTNFSSGGIVNITDTSHTTTVLLGQNSLGYVQKIGPFGTGINKVAVIIGVHPLEGAIHGAMLKALKSLASSLDNVQIWVYKVYVNDLSSYTTSRSNGQNLANQYVVPNIDTSYKLAIDIHGNRGLYDVYDFVFAPSKGATSVNYANKIVSTTDYLKYYYIADGTSPQYVTIPIANKGIPTVVYELFLNVNNYNIVFYNKCLQLVNGLNTIFAA